MRRHSVAFKHAIAMLVGSWLLVLSGCFDAVGGCFDAASKPCVFDRGLRDAHEDMYLVKESGICGQYTMHGRH
jgi:hypothetical protein